MDVDVQRIVDLPCQAAMTPDLVDSWSRYFCTPHAWADPRFKGLRKMQAEALAAFYQLGRAVVPLRVSAGKALIGWGCAAIAYNVHKVPKVLLIVPAKSLQNFWGKEQDQARQWLKNVPRAWSYDGLNHGARMKQAAKPGIHVITEGLIQSQKGREILKAIGAGAYIIDEVHNFSRTDAARTKRLIGLIKKSILVGDKVPMAIMSASSGTSGIPRIWELMYVTMREMSPMPTTKDMAVKFEQELDPASARMSEPPPGLAVVDAIVNWAATNIPGFKAEYSTANRRQAVRLRMLYTPGMIIDPEKPERTDTTIHRIICGKPNEKVQELWKQCEMGITPSGDEMSSHLDQYRFFEQLTCGYYVLLEWPSPALLAVRRGCSESEARQLLDDAQELRDLENAYHKALRKYLSQISDDDPMDTPFKVGQFFQQCDGHPPRLTALYRLWKEWKDFEREHPNLPERDRKPILVDDYKLRMAVDWAKQGPGLLWVYNEAPFRWMEQYLRKAGINPLVCDSGDRRMKTLFASRGKADPDRVYLIRLGGYGEAVELDFTHRALYLQWQRNAKTMEQSLGRMDRSGQKSERLEISCFFGSTFDTDQFSATICTAAKDVEVHSASHLLLEAEYDPPIEELSDAKALARMFEDFKAGDVDTQKLLETLRN